MMNEILKMWWELLKAVFMLIFAAAGALIMAGVKIGEWLWKLLDTWIQKRHDANLLRQQLAPMKWDMFTAPPMPEGQGDAASLVREIEEAPAGAVVRLQAGLYRLDNPLTIAKSVHLEGAGMDKTRILYAGKDNKAAITIVGDSDVGAQRVVISDVTVERVGVAEEDVVVVTASDCTLEIVRCALTGGRSSTGLSATKLLEPTRILVRECKVYGNSTGIQVNDEVEAIIEDNLVWGNEVGIAYIGQARGEARGNICVRNKCGIFVYGDSEPIIQHNRCWRNDEGGIGFGDKAGGKARSNECVENGTAGIMVVHQSHPVLEDNLCFLNGKVGIFYEDSTAPLLGDNQCLGNGQAGILKAEL